MKLLLIVSLILSLCIISSCASYPGGTFRGDINLLYHNAYAANINTTIVHANNALTWLALNKTRIDTTNTYLGTNVTKITNLQANRPHLTVLAGHTPAANFTLTGAVVGDHLGGVLYVTKTAGNLTTVTDLTSEFTGTGKGIIASAVLNQSRSGTGTNGGYVIVSWEHVGQ